MHFDRSPFTRSCEAVAGGGGGGGGGGSLNDFKFGTFIGRFLSEGAASMAVEELNYFA